MVLRRGSLILHIHIGKKNKKKFLFETEMVHSFDIWYMALSDKSPPTLLKLKPRGRKGKNL